MKKLSILLILIISFASININAQENAFVFDYAGGGVSYIDLTDGTTTGMGSAMASMGAADFGPDNVNDGLVTFWRHIAESTMDAVVTCLESNRSKTWILPAASPKVARGQVPVVEASWSHCLALLGSPKATIPMARGRVSLLWAVWRQGFRAY